ncbi:MAG: VWA domain-containing protein [Ruminococcaceae bacterium]|nr:VWA domain-containing protein [Oscillospiraceae bacterium]
MKNNLTELVFILDKSGSMSGLEGDTIGGFNSMIERQKKQEGECFVSTLLFDTEVKVIHDREKLKEVRKITDGDYVVGGCTALLDAVGSAISHIENIHKYARSEDVPKRTMFVITTDGYENASKEYSFKTVKEMIGRKRKEKGWEFIFIGANIDVAETAENLGIAKEQAVNYHADKKGTGVVYDAVEKAVACVRSRRPLEASCWSEELRKDFKAREKNT